MLKIKDNVDLKELEKYGLKHLKKYKVYSEDERWGYFKVDEDGEYARIIKIVDDIHENDNLDVLYDLIKADLVEKVD